MAVQEGWIAMVETMTEEATFAEELLKTLPETGSSTELVSEDEGSVRFRVRRAGWKLATVVFSRPALRRLLEDPVREVKADHIRRDILRAAARRTAYSYPRRPLVGCYS